MAKVKMITAILLIILAIIIGYFFVGLPSPSEDIVWGVNFSQKRAEEFGFDWKENYLAILDDLGAKKVRIGTYWNLLEPKEKEYYFADLDWQMSQAQERGVDVILVIGRKTPGWPECHVPGWAKEKTKKEQQEAILKLLEKTVKRYMDYSVLEYWQVENEPFFPFGKCLWKDKSFLKKEINLVKSIDPSRQIIVSDSGEFSLWFKAANYGDIVGTTMYKKAWFEELGLYVYYPIPPVFYKRKANLVKWFFGKEVINIELQAEPWGPVLNYKLPLEEQRKTMNLNYFKRNIEFAKKTKLNKFYLWGAEWWYWMKEKHNQPEFWEEAKKLFN